MNNLLFTALIMALLYYFFYYLPSQKKLNTANPPLKHHQSTQTENITETNSADILNCPGMIQGPSAQIAPDEIKDKIKKLEKDIQQKEQTITNLNNSYTKLETNKNKELTDLKEQIKTITHQLSQLQTHQNKDEKALENTLDQLLKGIQDLNTELN